MNLAIRRGLPALFTVALAAGVAAVGTPALAAGEAPTGTYALDSAAIWTGQQVKITQSALADDDVDPAAVTRTIDFGDGTTVTAAAGETSWAHKYAAAGAYPVKVTLDDGTVSGPGTITGTSTVTVSAVPGTYGWQKNRLWTAEVEGSSDTYLVESQFTAAGVPANSTASFVTWGDDETSVLREGSTATVEHWFPGGTWSPKVTVQNAQGRSAARTASPLSVLVDRTGPAVSLTYPASPNRASSWKAIRGIARDSQSGPDIAAVYAVKQHRTTGALAYYNFSTRKWIGANDGTLIPSSAIGVANVSSTGAWSAPIAGLAKNYYLQVGYFALDKVGNVSNGGDAKWAQITLSS